MNFGVKNIGKPTPNKIQFALQIIVILGGVAAVAIQAAPDQFISVTLKNYILTVGAAGATALASIASLFGEKE